MFALASKLMLMSTDTVSVGEVQTPVMLLGTTEMVVFFSEFDTQLPDSV